MYMHGMEGTGSCDEILQPASLHLSKPMVTTGRVNCSSLCVNARQEEGWMEGGWVGFCQIWLSAWQYYGKIPIF